MTTVTPIQKWRKQNSSVQITTPVPESDIIDAYGSDYMRDFLRLYHALLITHKLSTIKLLDIERNTLVDLELYINKDVPESGLPKLRRKAGLNWKARERFVEMLSVSGSVSLSELFSRALYVGWRIHQHVVVEGYFLIVTPGETPTIISYEDFFE